MLPLTQLGPSPAGIGQPTSYPALLAPPRHWRPRLARLRWVSAGQTPGGHRERREGRHAAGPARQGLTVAIDSEGLGTQSEAAALGPGGGHHGRAETAGCARGTGGPWRKGVSVAERYLKKWLTPAEARHTIPRTHQSTKAVLSAARPRAGGAPSGSRGWRPGPAKAESSALWRALLGPHCPAAEQSACLVQGC